jgi:hypothetical protein
MALVDLTKQLAQQAILSATSAPEKKEAPAPAAAVDNTGITIFAEVQAMQRALKEDEELVVQFQSGTERIRVMELFLRTPQVAVVSGQDSNRNLTRVITPVSSLQLLCKTMKVAPGAKPVRIALITAKKDSTSK